MPSASHLQSLNPATGAEVAAYPVLSPAELGRTIEHAAAAQAAWRRTSPAERGAPIATVAHLLDRDREAAARLITEEMGKPIAQARAEIEKCAGLCRYYAARAESLLAPRATDPELTPSARILLEPLGVVLAIMPWNFPFWQVFRAAVPSLLAGNAVLLKHAPNVTGCALRLEELLSEAGFPPGLFATLRVEIDAVPEIIRHPAVQGVALTGSARAGRVVAGLAGAALKRSALELGGSDAYLVLEDADLELAARATAASRLINSGQSCICAKRMIVVESVRPRFEALLLEAISAVQPGNPLDSATRLGPLARDDLRAALDQQVASSVAAGARPLLAPGPIAGPGFFYRPGILCDVRPGMAAFDEEVFGPVAAVIAARDEIEAVALANASPYGLGAGIFTRDAARAERLARELDAGNVAVNSCVVSDARLPFGGIKASGYGRELGEWGVREFANLKTVRGG
jgi:succinate-semialdehyde dehydrogenase / glutarate-semialdehyde dehydrogenase